MIFKNLLWRFWPWASWRKFSSKLGEKSAEWLEYLSVCRTVKDWKDSPSPSNTGRSAFFRRCLTLRVLRPSAPGLDAEPGEQLSGVKFLWRGMRQTGQSPVLGAAAGVNATNAVVNVFSFSFFPPSPPLSDRSSGLTKSPLWLPCAEA